MATIPKTLANRLYEPDSLHNTDNGFELAFKNRLAPSTVIGLGPLTVGKDTFDSSRLTLRLERPATRRHGRTPSPLVRAGSDIKPKKALAFDLNAVARISVDGFRLSPGTYELSFALQTIEVGDIIVSAVDRIEPNGGG